MSKKLRTTKRTGLTPRQKKALLQLTTQAVINYTGVTYEQLISNARFPVIVDARYIIYHILRIRSNYTFSFNEIGNAFNRDHATVMWGCKKVQDMIDIEDESTLKILLGVSKKLDEKYSLIDWDVY